MANITTVRGRSDWSTNREKLDFAEGIALLDPNKNPFTLMTMKYKRGTTGNTKHSWLTDELIPETDTVDTTTACVTAGTTLWVDNGDRFAIGDIIMRTSGRETLLVTDRSSDALTVVRDYGSTSGAYTALASSFTDEEVITIIGNAFEDGHPLPALRSTKEIQIDNYCQPQRTPFGIGEIANASAQRGENDWAFQMRKAGIEHMRKIEYQNLWGHPMPGDGSIYATTNSAPAAGGGLWHFLTGGTGFSGTGSGRRVSQAEITKAEFLTWIQNCFRYGSAQKVCYCAPILRSAIDSWGIADLQTFSTDKVYGINIAKWVSSHGTIVFVTHKMLEQQGAEGATNFMIDMEDVSWLTLGKYGDTRMRTLKPYEADGTTIMEAEYQTVGCLELKTPKKHGVLYAVTSYAA